MAGGMLWAPSMYFVLLDVRFQKAGINALACMWKLEYSFFL